MQYESVLLEMLSRIKHLEDEVAALKQKTEAIEERLARGECCSVEATEEAEEETTEEQVQETAGSYQRMTDEMIARCYQYGKAVHGGANAQELADKLYEETGMNRASAVIYLYAVRALLTGTVFKRAISSKAMQQYLNNIRDEYGNDGLRKALNALRSHVAYRRRCGHIVDSIEELCRRYERQLQ